MRIDSLFFILQGKSRQILNIIVCLLIAGFALTVSFSGKSVVSFHDKSVHSYIRADGYLLQNSSQTEISKFNVDGYSPQNSRSGELSEFNNGSQEKLLMPPVQHIAFIKVHKCGSSTAQNVFLRYGYERNLTFLMGKLHRLDNPYSNVISLSQSLNDKNVQPVPVNKSFDIVCFHVLYNRTAFEKYMPKDTTYIGIMRDPYEMFRSILSYFRPRQVLGHKGRDPITEFFKHGNYMGMPDFFLTANPLAYEYGAPTKLRLNFSASLLDAFIRQLEREFKIIIISEFFEESMVLMRRFLHWDTKGILYVDLNVSDKSRFKVVATSKHRDMVYRRASLDVVIYRHFYRRLWEQIRHEGKDFFDELLEYRRLRRKVNIFCSEKEYQTDNVMVVEKTQWSEGFKVSHKDCKLMTMFEMTFTKMIREKQWGPEESV